MLAEALHRQLPEYQLVKPGRAVSMEQLSEFVTLVQSFEAHGLDVKLCLINAILQVKESSSSKPGVLKFCREWSRNVVNDENTPDLPKALLAIIYEETWQKALASKNEIDLMCRELLKYSSLRSLIPAVKVLPVKQGYDIEQIGAIITHLLPMPKTRLEYHVYRQAFKTLALEQSSEEDYVNTLITFFATKRQMPPLNRLLDFDSMDKIRSAGAFYRLVRTIIQKANLTGKASVELALYFIFQRDSDEDALLRLSLFTEFCLVKLDNKYFDMLKELIEDFLANSIPSTKQICHVVGLVRRIAQCEKTEYSAKLIELVQDILSLLNGRSSVDAMGRDELNLLEMCIGVLTDMVDNEVLQFFRTHEIFKKKFPAIAQALTQKVKSARYSHGYSMLLATVNSELFDLNLDECFYSFSTKPAGMSVEERDAYETCLETNKVVFDYILPSKDCRAIAKIAFYVLDQGLRAKIAQEYFAANTEAGDEQNAQGAIDAKFKEAQGEMWTQLMALCSQSVLRDVAASDDPSHARDVDNGAVIKRRALGSVALLSELFRIDLKAKADPRQIRNIDLSKRVLSGAEMGIDDQLASIERSVVAASKHRMFGALPKTILNLCKSIKAGRPHQDELIEVTVLALIGLDDQSLLKIGPDLANVCSLAVEHHSGPDFDSYVGRILSRVGRLDNDLVVLALRDAQGMLIQSPKLFKELVFDLVKFYFKPQPAQVEKVLKTMLAKAFTGSIEACRSVSEVIAQLHKDSTVEDSSLQKFMAVCAGLKLPELVQSEQADSTELKVQFLCEKARLSSWFGMGRVGGDLPELTILRLMAEADLA